MNPIKVIVIVFVFAGTIMASADRSESVQQCIDEVKLNSTSFILEKTEPEYTNDLASIQENGLKVTFKCSESESQIHIETNCGATYRYQFI